MRGARSRGTVDQWERQSGRRNDQRKQGQQGPGEPRLHQRVEDPIGRMGAAEGWEEGVMDTGKVMETTARLGMASCHKEKTASVGASEY